MELVEISQEIEKYAKCKEGIEKNLISKKKYIEELKYIAYKFMLEIKKLEEETDIELATEKEINFFKELLEDEKIDISSLSLEQFVEIAGEKDFDLCVMSAGYPAQWRIWHIDDLYVRNIYYSLKEKKSQSYNNT